MTLHTIIWLAGVPHYMSVPYIVGRACHWTCGAVNKGCVVGPAEAGMVQHIVWFDRMLCDAKPTVNAVCHWMCSPLDAMLSRAMLGGLYVVALTGRIRTYLCAVHHWTCWKDMRCCTTKVQSQSPTLSPCICSGAVASLPRTGMWLACLSFSSQCSYVSFEQ